jgi:diacylglycerol O-acyltransferase / wax synthase
VVCPVSIRKGDQGDTLGNRISFLPVSLPMDVADPVQLLKAVAVRTQIMKSSRAAELVGIAASWLGAAPPPVQSLFWRGIPLVPMPVPLFNIICTNVPGSPTPLYSVGKRMLASYPHVPTGYELGVGCAVQSYDGKMFFGLTADADVAKDVRLLRDFIRTSWDDLCHAAGIRKAPRRSTAGGRKQAPRTKAAKAKTMTPRPAAAPPPATVEVEPAIEGVPKAQAPANVVESAPPLAHAKIA